MELLETPQDEEKKILYIDVNQYYFYDKSQKNQQIIGMFTMAFLHAVLLFYHLMRMSIYSLHIYMKILI